MKNIYAYWGKARPQIEEKGAQYHLLPYHCLDVVAVANCWWQQDKALQRLFMQTSEEDPAKLRAWLLFFTALHDLGKFDVRFQWKAPDAARVLQPAFEKQFNPDKRFNHGVAGYRWFCQEISAYGFSEYADEAIEWMKAVVGHHGNNPEQDLQTAKFAAPQVLKHDRQARIDWVTQLRTEFLEPVGIAPEEEPPQLDYSLLAGFCSVADWIGSNTGENNEYFSYQDTPNLPDYLDSRREIAQCALHEFGIYRPALVQGGMDIFPDKTPRSVQTKVEQLPLETGLTLIEAATGSGKTEAALAYASRLLAAGLADSIIFALPTQATSNAMLERFMQDKIGTKLFPDETQNIVLAHGKARFNSNAKLLKAAPYHSLTHQGKEEALSQCSQWLAASRKRVFLGQIGICTIDQVLLSVLPIRHNFVRALGVYKSVLIVDEVHAYDHYMYGLLTSLLENQAKTGGSAILLSATLPASTKSRLLSAWKQGKKPDTSNAYPLITHAGTTPCNLDLPLPDRPERSVTFSLQATADLLPDAELLDNIIQAAQQGAKVAVVCNLVNDAQTLWAKLQGKTGDTPLDLFHARFRFKDRNLIEGDVLKHYGKDAAAGGRILIATQVVEQSLDLDFDWLITQICPVDLLFQRLGRLHRHSRQRPVGYETPQCTVLIPENEDYKVHALLYGAKSERQWLPNRRILWRTQRMIENSPVADFPQVYRSWIEQVYQEEAWTDEASDIQAEYEAFSQALEGKYYSAKFLTNLAKSFPDDDEYAAAMTRDGEMNLIVYPCMMENGQLCFLNSKAFDDLDDWQWQEALNLNGVSVPENWRECLKETPDPHNNKIQRCFLPMTPAENEEWTAETEQCHFTYSQTKGLQKLTNE